MNSLKNGSAIYYFKYYFQNQETFELPRFKVAINYKLYVERLWDFIKEYIIDQKEGEWYWGRNENLSLMSDDDKLGIWKCPYHNSRACLEIGRRLRNN